MAIEIQFIFKLHISTETNTRQSPNTLSSTRFLPGGQIQIEEQTVAVSSGGVGSCSGWGNYLSWENVLPGGVGDRRKLCQIYITRGEFPTRKVFNKKSKGVCGEPICGIERTCS